MYRLHDASIINANMCIAAHNNESVWQVVMLRDTIECISIKLNGHRLISTFSL